MGSSFISPTPGSAYWQKGSSLCQSTGRAVLSDVRGGLIWESRGSMSADAESAAVQREADEAGRSGWSVTLLLSLANLLNRYHFTSQAAAVNADAARLGQPISATTMQSALWAAYGLASTSGQRASNHHVGSPNDFVFEAGTVFPTVGSIPPMPTDAITAGASCAPGHFPGSTMIPSQGVTGFFGINPVLFAILLAAGGYVAYKALEASQKGQGARW